MGIIFPLFSSIAFALGAFSGPTFAVVDSRQVQKLIDEAQASGGLPAIGALIRSDDKIVFLEAQGKRSMQNDEAATVLDKWHLGSNTKAMTAYLFALAVQDRRLSYDSLVVDFVKDASTVAPLNKDLTVRDLLSHGSGLHDVQEIEGGKLWERLSKSSLPLLRQRALMMNAALKENPHKDPNDRSKPMRSYSYANINQMIVGSVLETVYGVAWENLIKTQLFDRLQMFSCGFGVTGDMTETTPSQPWPHYLENGVLVGIPPKYKADNPPMLGPAGTVHCSLEDWSKFLTELINTWHGKGRLLTSADIAAKYFSTEPENSYALGGWIRVDEDRTPLFMHDGSNTFNYSSAVLSLEKRSFILLTTNTAHPEGQVAIRNLKNSLIGLIIKR